MSWRIKTFIFNVPVLFAENHVERKQPMFTDNFISSEPVKHKAGGIKNGGKNKTFCSSLCSAYHQNQ